MPLSGIEHRPFGRSAHNLVYITTGLFWFSSFRLAVYWLDVTTKINRERKMSVTYSMQDGTTT
jgi:hypothetical protein